jgi:hypothetical protein
MLLIKQYLFATLKPAKTLKVDIPCSNIRLCKPLDWSDQLGHHPGRGVFDHCALEKVRVHPAVKLDRIGEHEVAEILFGHQPLFNPFISFDSGVAHVDQVIVTEVGAVNRVESGSERIPL